MKQSRKTSLPSSFVAGLLGAFTLAAYAVCLQDTTQIDFQAGTPTSVDVTASPNNLVLASGPLVNQQNTTVTANGFGFTATSWAGQTFVPTVTGPLNRVDLDLFCSGCSGTTPDIAVSIRATTGTPPVPTGPDLAVATITGFSNGAGAYFTANFAAPATVTAGAAYAVIMHPVANPSPGVYAYVCSCTTSTNPYASGQRVTSSNSGTSWTADTTSGGRDLGFAVYVGTGYVPHGAFVSSVKDSAPPVSTTPIWTTLSWNANTPAATALSFQVAGSNSAAGPFTFVGPDGTVATSFTSNSASLSQFNGQRYLQYKAVLDSSDSALTPTVQDVQVCFQDPPFAVSSAASPALGGVANCVSPVVAGSSTTCSTTPNLGYVTQSMSGCGGTPTGLRVNSFSTGLVAAACTVTATFAPTLNVDQSVGLASYDAESAGLIVLRYLQGIRNGELIAGTSAPAGSHGAITTYLDNNLAMLDVDGNGTPETTTDGVLILRYMLGFRGSALIADAIGSGSPTRNTATAIEAWLAAYTP